ncbi:MAG: chemotaxis protein CheX [Bdellovibrionales bacterium]|nr:chemotaxis protein CheX [Bdellovibrionales bacterium]
MSDTRETIEKVTTRILEDWAMMMVEPLPNVNSAFNQEEPYLLATVKFKGVMSGTYHILCQEGFLDNLAGNLLGFDEHADSEERNDALREMANVLCGNLLTECYGDDTVFDLSLPEVHEIEADKISTYFNNRSASYLADEEPVLVTFSAEESHAN